ncbi:hypothetical protein ABFS83_13G049200 [Erythranthe nasuta]
MSKSSNNAIPFHGLFSFTLYISTTSNYVLPPSPPCSCFSFFFLFLFLLFFSLFFPFFFQQSLPLTNSMPPPSSFPYLNSPSSSSRVYHAVFSLGAHDFKSSEFHRL